MQYNTYRQGQTAIMRDTPNSGIGGVCIVDDTFLEIFGVCLKDLPWSAPRSLRQWTNPLAGLFP